MFPVVVPSIVCTLRAVHHDGLNCARTKVLLDQIRATSGPRGYAFVDLNSPLPNFKGKVYLSAVPHDAQALHFLENDGTSMCAAGWRPPQPLPSVLRTTGLCPSSRLRGRCSSRATAHRSIRVAVRPWSSTAALVCRHGTYRGGVGGCSLVRGRVEGRGGGAPSSKSPSMFRWRARRKGDVVQWWSECCRCSTSPT
jgi:hypothetical protein